MVEELSDRRTQAGARPDVTETATIVAKAPDEHWSIYGTTKRTANESSRGLWRHIDGLIHRCDFCDRDTVVNCI
jgi:hypothetical protein